MNRFELSQEGDLHIEVKYYDVVVDCVVKVSEDDLRKIMDLIPKEPITEKVVACDGDAWEFTAFDDSGNVVFSRDLDYIYGIDYQKAVDKIDWGDPFSFRDYLPV